MLVAGLDGNRDSARLALEAVRWFKTAASDDDRARWTVSVLPLANPDGHVPTEFPPADGFFNDPERPEHRYAWRWVAYQVPDVVVEIRAGGELRVKDVGNEGPLSAALADPDNGNGLGPVRTLLVTVRTSDGARVMEEVLAAASRTRSSLRDTIGRRLAREPIAIARLLADAIPAGRG